MHAAAAPETSAPPEPTPTTPARFAVHAWSPPLRLLGALARLTALGSLLYFTALLVQDVAEGQQRVQPGPVARGLALGVLLPLVLSAVLRRLTRATLDVGATGLTLTPRDATPRELPYDTVEAVRPWKLPLPGAGLTVRLKTGGAFTHALGVEDAVPLLTELGPRGLGAAEGHPHVRYAQARHALWKRRWYHFGFKFGVFPALLAGVFFRAHQYIAFGGPFGEYQMFGLASYLRSYVRIWVPVALSLVLFACLWRTVAEVLSFAGAWLAPRRARGFRLVAEWLCRLVYYAGLPAFAAWRFLS